MSYPRLNQILKLSRYSTTQWFLERLEPWLTGLGFNQINAATIINSRFLLAVGLELSADGKTFTKKLEPGPAAGVAEEQVHPAPGQVETGQSHEVIWQAGTHPDPGAGDLSLVLRSAEEATKLLPLPPGRTWIVVRRDEQYPEGLKLWLCERPEGETREAFLEKIDNRQIPDTLLFNLLLTIDKENPSVVWLRFAGAYPKLRQLLQSKPFSTPEWYSDQLEPWLEERGFNEIRLIEVMAGLSEFRSAGFEDIEPFGVSGISKKLRSAEKSGGGAWHVGDMAKILSDHLSNASDKLVLRFTAGLADPLKEVITSAAAKSKNAPPKIRRQTFVDNLKLNVLESMELLYQWAEQSIVDFDDVLQKKVRESLERQYRRNGLKVEARTETHVKVSGKSDISMTVHISQQGFPALTINVILSNRGKFFSDPGNHILAHHRAVNFGDYNYTLVLQKRLFDLDDPILDLVLKHEVEEMMVLQRSGHRMSPAEAHRLALQALRDERAVEKVQEALRAQNLKDATVRKLQRRFGMILNAAFIRDHAFELESVRADAEDYLAQLPLDYSMVSRYAGQVPPVALMLDLMILHWQDPDGLTEFIANLPRLERLLGRDWFKDNWVNLVTAYHALGGRRFDELFERAQNDPWLRDKSREWLQKYFLEIPDMRPMIAEKDIEAVFEGGLEGSGSEFDDLKSAIRSYPDIMVESIKTIYGIRSIDFRTDDIVKVGIKKIGDGASNAVFLLTEIVLSNGRVISQYPIVMKVSKESTFDFTHQHMQKVVQAAKELADHHPSMHPQVGGQWIFDYLNPFWIVTEGFVSGPTLSNELEGIKLDPEMDAVEKEERIKGLLARKIEIYLTIWKIWNEHSGATHWVESKFIGDPGSPNLIGGMLVDANSLLDTMAPAEIIERLLEKDMLDDMTPMYPILVALALRIMGEDLGRQFLGSSQNEGVARALQEHDAINVGESGPAMRESGRGLTQLQHELVNEAIGGYFADPEKAKARRLLEPDGIEYKALDPAGVLRDNGINIYVFEGLLQRIKVLSSVRKVDPPLDLLIHPGRALRNLYIDSDQFSMMLARDQKWREKSAAHELWHILNPYDAEAVV